MPFDEAAALLMTYGTSHHALKGRGQLAVGEAFAQRAEAIARLEARDARGKMVVMVG